MKKYLFSLIAMLVPLAAFADGYNTLWQKVKDAQKKDLPRTEITVLQQIANKAAKEKQYGQLLKAQFMRSAAEASISPDSVEKDIATIEKCYKQAADPAVKAVYASALGRIYKEKHESSTFSDTISKKWYKISLTDPAMLAKHQSNDFEPAFVKGIDSSIFNGDLLHVIGMEADDYKTLHHFYNEAGNRAAACICAWKDLTQHDDRYSSEARRKASLLYIDSLISVYKDLPEAGQLAIEHYYAIEADDNTKPEQLVEYINYALNNWESWKEMNILRNKLADLEQPAFRVHITENMQLPNKPFKVYINSVRNIGSLHFNIYKVNINGCTNLDPSKGKDYAQLKVLMDSKPSFSATTSYDGQPAWKEIKDSVIIEGLPIGVYIFEAKTNDSKIKPQRCLLRVSSIFVMNQALPGKRIRYAVVNGNTGKPIVGAQIKLGIRNGNVKTTTTITTDNNGEAYYTYQRNQPFVEWAYTNDDKAWGGIYGTSYYSYWSGGNRTIKHMSLYTDRSLYRPGQTVHVAAIAWTSYKDSLTSKADESKKVTFSLRDANGKQVSEKTSVTDSYGSASADLVLPNAGLTGVFNVYATTGDRASSTFFHVEQYKRPTFRVEFEKFNGKYEAGDTISLRGVATTYSGIPVQGAKVEYTVRRRQGLWWWHGNAKTVVADSSTTADDGSFIVQVPMVYPDDIDLKRAVYFNFDINAKITDGAGETHEGTTALPLSNRSAILSTNLPEKMLKDSLHSVTFSYKNLLGEEIPDSKVHFRFDNGIWKTAVTSQAATIVLNSGKHNLEAVCGSDTLRKDVVVFSYNDSRPATTTNDWFYISNDKFPENGSPVFLQVGSSATGTQLYWTVCAGQKIIDSGTKPLSNEVLTHKLQYSSEYGDGITVSVAWVVNGKIYSHTASISRPMPNTSLKLTWKTFRNKLIPGQKETWTLNIQAPNGKPAKAQLLATMYDKSLDAIYSHNWTFSNNFSLSLPSTRWNGNKPSTIYLYGDKPYNSLNSHGLQFTHFDNELFGWSTVSQDGIGIISLADGGRLYRHSEMMMMSKAVEPSAMGAVENSLASEDVTNSTDVNKESKVDIGTEAKHESAQIRENFNETAFFYPTLMSDKHGDVSISFTLPESVTTWRFMGLAHDSIMNNGLINADIIASKPISVQPNMPRFLRVGDKGTISTRIFNMSDNDVNGKVHIEILEPETGKVLSSQDTTFSVAGKGTALETFDVNPSDFTATNDDKSLFIARIVAEGEGFSDGEQQYLPILPDKEMVTNTVPFYQNEPGVKNIDLTKIFPLQNDEQANNRKLTIEYVNNPAWLVIQALPSVANPSAKDAMSLAAAIYANVIGRSVLTSSPKIATIIKLWQQETGNNTSLTSNLEKDEELKYLVLNETPWVADVERETDQKKQLADFLDESVIDHRINDFSQKLENLQNGDGSFSWWPGMSGNTYMTSSILETLVRLNSMVGKQEKTASMIDKAFYYLDREMSKEVSELKKEEKKGFKNITPSETACRWLYTSALAGRKQTADITYMISLLDRAPSKLTIYGKAGTAVILAQYGRTNSAKEYLQSLREYTVYKDENGRYFDTPKASYSWFDYRIPTQTFAIEALQRLTPYDTLTIREMQRWLLHEKRTTGWNTTINCVNAVYAFCHGAGQKGNWIKLDKGETMSKISLNGKALDLPKATAGIGYVKITADATEPRTLTIDKTSSGTSWGAVYGQFMQKATEVGNASSGLTVSRQIISNEDITKSENEISRLSVGDKIIVRLTITADRDYDFVQLQDKRAACMEPTRQLSGYHWYKGEGYYCAPQDNVTNYYFDHLRKGSHIVETTYYIDRTGDYHSGTCTVQCAYSPEFCGRESAKNISIK